MTPEPNSRSLVSLVITTQLVDQITDLVSYSPTPGFIGSPSLMTLQITELLYLISSSPLYLY
jgi:hypothetical protein